MRSFVERLTSSSEKQAACRYRMRFFDLIEEDGRPANRFRSKLLNWKGSELAAFDHWHRDGNCPGTRQFPAGGYFRTASPGGYHLLFADYSFMCVMAELFKKRGAIAACGDFEDGRNFTMTTEALKGGRRRLPVHWIGRENASPAYPRETNRPSWPGKVQLRSRTYRISSG